MGNHRIACKQSLQNHHINRLPLAVTFIFNPHCTYSKRPGYRVKSTQKTAIGYKLPNRFLHLQNLMVNAFVLVKPSDDMLFNAAPAAQLKAAQAFRQALSAPSSRSEQTSLRRTWPRAFFIKFARMLTLHLTGKHSTWSTATHIFDGFFWRASSVPGQPPTFFLSAPEQECDCLADQSKKKKVAFLGE